MKVRSKPQEYEAIEFRDDIEVCYEIQEFLKSHSAELHCTSNGKILSTVIGNTRLKDGDIIYKSGDLIVGVLIRGDTFDKHFEVVEE